jgi:hypothetical protein
MFGRNMEPPSLGSKYKPKKKKASVKQIVNKALPDKYSVAMQRINAIIKELLDSPFSVLSVPYERTA